MVFVALDDQDRPTAVPPFEPQTEEEKRVFQDAELRRHFRLSLGDEARSGN